MVYKQVFRMIYVYYIEPLKILQDCLHGFLVTVLYLYLSFSPAEWSTDMVMNFFCYVSMFCNFDLIKKIGLL